MGEEAPPPTTGRRAEHWAARGATYDLPARGLTPRSLLGRYGAGGRRVRTWLPSWDNSPSITRRYRRGVWTKASRSGLVDTWPGPGVRQPVTILDLSPDSAT